MDRRNLRDVPLKMEVTVGNGDELLVTRELKKKKNLISKAGLKSLPSKTVPYKCTYSPRN